jgi:hypothetical protein
MILLEPLLGIAALIAAGLMLRRVGSLDARLREYQRNPAERPSISRWPSEPTERYHVDAWPLLARRSRALWATYAFAFGGVALLAYVCAGIAR